MGSLIRLGLILGLATIVGYAGAWAIVSRDQDSTLASSPQKPAVASTEPLPTGGIRAPFPEPSNASPPPSLQRETGLYSDPAQVARNFLHAYTSFDWRDPDPNRAVRERTRPWATDSLNQFLDTGSSAAHMTEQRVRSQEVATLEIVSMDPVSPKGEDLVTFTSLGLNHKAVSGPTPEPRAQFYELTVVRHGDRWLVDRIRL